MRRALAGLSKRPDLLLVDGNISRGYDIPSKAIIGGDGLSASIAAASILAKVSRDRYMLELAEKYPGYSFEKHKGYGTKEHIEAITRLGVCPEHRLSFLKNIVTERR
jgi:ribonuclease HII